MDAFEALISNDIDDWAALVARCEPDQVRLIFSHGLTHLRESVLPRRQILTGLLAVLTRGDIALDADECAALLQETASLIVLGRDADLLLALVSVLLRRVPEMPSSVVMQTESALELIAGGGSPEADGARSTLRRHSHFILSKAINSDALMGSRRTAVGVDLDYEQAIASVHLDIPGDWYKDPWEWSELRVLNSVDGFRRLSRRTASHYTAPATQLDMSKPDNGVRPAVVLDIEDRVCYEALVDTFSRSALQSLPSWVFGWRTSRVPAGADLYESNRDEWRMYASWLTEMSSSSKYCLKVDIGEFFASVSISSLMSVLEAAGAEQGVIARLEAMISAWNRVPGRQGLPQRCHASSVLAQLALSRLDTLLADREHSEGVKVCRWMDDVTVYADSESQLIVLRDDIEEVLHEDGMSLNVTKTLLEPSSTELVAQLLRAASGVQDQIAANAANLPESLSIYVRQLLEHPASAPRSALSFVCKRMRKFGILSGGLERGEVIETVPQAADVVARAVRDTGHWSELQDWYVGQAQHRKAAVDWSIQAWGLMFATADAEVVADYFSGVLHKTLPTLLLPLAAIRTAQWEDSALDAIRVAAGLCRTPFEMRAVSLAGHRAGAGQGELREWLAGFPSLSATATVLEHGRSTLSPDFEEADEW